MTDYSVYLRELDAGTDNAGWVVCAKGDPDAVEFVPAMPLWLPAPPSERAA